MKKKTMLLIAVPLIAVLAAAPQSASADPCTAKNVKLRLNAYEMRLRPKEPRCIEIGKTFKIKLPKSNTYKPGLGEVVVREKIEGDVEIRGSNDVKVDEVVVTVSGPANATGDFAYFVTVDGIGQLDPLVRVIGGGEFRQARWTAYQDVLDEELGMTLDEVNMLEREFYDQAE